MCWPLAHLAEVAGSAHNAIAEMLLPDAVDHHARGKRVFGAGDGFGQFQPAASFLEGRWLAGGKDRQKPARRLVTQIIGTAANMDADVVRLIGVPDGM